MLKYSTATLFSKRTVYDMARDAQAGAKEKGGHGNI